MNKLKATLIIYGLSALIFLTGCADKGTLEQSTTIKNGTGFNSEKNESSNADAKIDLMPITTVRETFDEEAEKLKNRKFDNINFENAYFSFPEAVEVYDFEYKDLIAKSSWGPDEVYDYLCTRIDDLFPGMYSDEQKAHEIRFGDAEAINWKTAEGSYRWPDLEQYKEMNLATDRPINPAISNKECYIEIYGSALRGYDQGDLERRIGYDGKIDVFNVLSEFPVVYRTKNLESQKTYHLTSGDISIADAVKSANKALSELELSSRSLQFKPSVQSVNVLDIGDNCFAFCFNIVAEYKQIQFNALEMDITTDSVQTLYDSTNEIDMFGEATMYEADKITRYRMLSYFADTDIDETNAYGSIIPIEKAAEVASDSLTGKIKFKALSATAVYKRFSAKEANQYSEDEDYTHREITVKPCWRFVLKPTTGDTKKLYYIFVDMITGRTYITSQQMRSDMEYD